MNWYDMKFKPLRNFNKLLFDEISIFNDIINGHEWSRFCSSESLKRFF